MTDKLQARSWLFTPANREDMLAKLHRIPADVCVLDLEDAVPAEEKAETAAKLGSRLAALKEELAGRQLWVRTNAVEVPHMWYGDDYYEPRGVEDLSHVIAEGLDGVVIPKIESALGVARACGAVEALEHARGLPFGSIKVVLLMEMLQGFIDIQDIVRAAAEDPRVIGLMFGAGEFRLSAKLRWTKGEAELAAARASLSLHSGRAEFDVLIDGATTDMYDDDNYRRSAERGADFGFTGKMCIHPRQVIVANETFVPSKEEYDRAKKLLDVFAVAEGEGHGSVQLSGVIVEAPLKADYERIVRNYEAFSGGR
ncbi:HpcH/HpaI aldolase/citrate lyase family protein [Nocardia sp. NPDC059239]|uniref:HpcH/HpaI aldolase/citrate lyase family protein n=1 Tax=unclassified Nocardia TaxID=2637762 RepID=UPI00368DA15F